VPEGDTIHRTADRLRPALEGRALVRFEAARWAGHRPKPGTVVTGVEARGKHLLVHFDDGWLLRTHMRMTGSWHLYRTGERWRRPAHLARAVVEVEGWVAVCFSAPVVELARDDSGVAHLGPDLCAPDADIDRAVERMGVYAGTDDEIGAVLLDQRVAAGVGNVYKSEVLFACRVDPFAPVGRLDVATRRRLLATASKLLRANLGGGARVTAPGGTAVYGRQGQPCPRCGTPVGMRRQGEQRRTTYWCPACQPPVGA
jgi:endonuclease-8